MSAWRDKTTSPADLEHYLDCLAYRGQAKRDRKFARLRAFLETHPFREPFAAAVIGPGGGLELALLLALAARRQWRHPRIIGCDISPAILARLAQEFGAAPVLPLCADATRLACASGSLQLVSAASVQHEIYSYRQGLAGVRQSLAEYARVLAPGGILFLRDFTAPARAVWAVRLKTDVAVDFWRQFRAHFRSRHNETFAWCERTPTELVLDSYAAMELANHLAIKLLHDPEVPEIAAWREINERYIVGPDAWYVETLTRHGLRVLAYTVDDEPEHRAAVGAHLALAQLRAGGQAVPLSPPCGRFNLLLEKAGAQPG